MIGSEQLPFPYISVDGPEGLATELSRLLTQARNDAQFAASQHYVLYQLGGQKSLIKIDFSQSPYQFWYCDLSGRPATSAVTDTIAKFLWEECGEKDQFQELA